MKRAIIFAIALLILMTPSVHAVDYESVTYVDDGVQIDVQISADATWYVPLTGIAQVDIGIIPLALGITEINITGVDVTIHSKDTSGSGYSLLSAFEFEGVPTVTASSMANISESANLIVTGTGAECYFALRVVGTYSNGTHTTNFISSSSENLVGPFVISPSLAAPQTIVGIIVAIVSCVVIFGGIQPREKESRKEETKETS